MANWKVIAAAGLKVRSGPGTNYDEAADPVACGEVVIEAAQQSLDPAWLPVLLEDESVGWVARQYVEEDATDYQAQEAAKIAPELPGKALAAPIFQRDLTKLYGRPREDAPYLEIIDLWEFSPALAHVRDFNGNRWSCRVWGHKALEGPLKTAFSLLVARGLAGELRTFDGCFCIRKMTGGNSYSVHSWGMAVDFNAAENPYGGPVRFSRGFILCFAEAGFEAGALWRTPDGMHFQLPWTQDWRQSSNPLRPLLIEAPEEAPATLQPETPPEPQEPAPALQPSLEEVAQINRATELDLCRQCREIIVAAAQEHHWPPEIIAGIVSRESRFGLVSDTDGKGDAGHGHGLMQIDDRSFGDWLAANDWRDPATNIGMGVQILTDKYNYLATHGYLDSLSDADAQRAAIAAYNCGEGNMAKVLQAGEDLDSRTTGRDYSADVLARAEQFKEVFAV